MSSHILNERPQPDQVLTDIVDYVLNYKVESKTALRTAFYCFWIPWVVDLKHSPIQHVPSC